MPNEKLTFNFTQCEASIENVVMGVIAIEKIYRLVPDINATDEDRIHIDPKVDDFLKIYFEQYKRYFMYPKKNEEHPEYNYYARLKEDDQSDDLTILGIWRNPSHKG